MPVIQSNAPARDESDNALRGIQGPGRHQLRHRHRSQPPDQQRRQAQLRGPRRVRQHLGGAIGSVGNIYIDVAVKAAVGNALTHGIAVATGLQDKFNWRGVAASAVGAAAGQAIGQGLGLVDGAGRAIDGPMGFGERIAKQAISSFASNVIGQAATAKGGVDAKQIC